MSALEQRQTDDPRAELVARLRSPGFREQIQIALPTDVTPDRFIRATVTALMQNADLINADRDSLLQSVVKCAQDGLLPDGREAALVIFGKKAAYMPMIGGFRKIAAEFGWSLRTSVVYANDAFEFELGLEPRLVHRPTRPGGDRGNPVAAYAVGAHKDGRKEFEVLTRDDIEKVRKVARTQNVWNEWPDRMWEKTAGRRLFAKLPLGERDERVASVIEASAVDDPTTALYGPPQVNRATGEITQGTPPEAAADAAAETRAPGGGNGQQVEEPDNDAASETQRPPAGGGADDTGSSTPDDDPEPGGALEGEVVDDDVAAAEAVVPDGTHKGRTLAQVADAKDGEVWIKWSLRQPKYTGEFRVALETFARARLPDVAAWYDAWLDAGSPAGDAYAEWSKGRAA